MATSRTCDPDFFGYLILLLMAVLLIFDLAFYGFNFKEEQENLDFLLFYLLHIPLLGEYDSGLKSKTKSTPHPS